MTTRIRSTSANHAPVSALCDRPATDRPEDTSRLHASSPSGWLKKAGLAAVGALIAGADAALAVPMLPGARAGSRTLHALQPADAPSPSVLGNGPSLAAPPANYNFGWGNDTRVVPDQDFERWGQIYRPAVLTGNHPLVFFMHGQHAVCSDVGFDCGAYFAGACDPLPNHEGYAYIGQALAERGMVAVSVNMNAINCYDAPDQNFARGRLLLDTLQMVQSWNSSDTAPESLNLPEGGLVGQLSNRIGIMGHSRGGEGARAALAMWRDNPGAFADTVAGFDLPAVVELAPVDGQTGQIINVQDATWGVIIPLCDGDVSDLEGVHPYDRAVAAAHIKDTRSKNVYVVHGADHNKANTEWASYPDDYDGCAGPTNPTLSGTQERNLMGDAIVTFFEGTVGNASEAMRLFNPIWPLPQNVTALARIDRSYTPGTSPSTTRHLASTLTPFGSTELTYGFISDFADADNEPFQTPHMNVAGTIVQWSAGTETRGVDMYLSQDQSPQDLRGWATWDVRAARIEASPVNLGSLALSAAGNASLSATVSLVDADGNASRPLHLSNWANLYKPAGEDTGVPADASRVVLQSVRIPLEFFVGADLSRALKVRFSVAQDIADTMILADATLSKRVD